jgi:hypothetical protein
VAQPRVRAGIAELRGHFLVWKPEGAPDEKGRESASRCAWRSRPTAGRSWRCRGLRVRAEAGRAALSAPSGAPRRGCARSWSSCRRQATGPRSSARRSAESAATASVPRVASAGDPARPARGARRRVPAAVRGCGGREWPFCTDCRGRIGVLRRPAASGAGCRWTARRVLPWVPAAGGRLVPRRVRVRRTRRRALLTEVRRAAVGGGRVRTVDAVVHAGPGPAKDAAPHVGSAREAPPPRPRLRPGEGFSRGLAHATASPCRAARAGARDRPAGAAGRRRRSQVSCNAPLSGPSALFRAAS